MSLFDELTGRMPMPYHCPIHDWNGRLPCPTCWNATRVSDEQVTIGEHTGGSVNYYKVEVKHPTTAKEPYTAECNDIIEALDMRYAEANVFKAIWRICAFRQGKQKRGYDAIYDAEKTVFFGERILARLKSYRP